MKKYWEVEFYEFLKMEGVLQNILSVKKRSRGVNALESCMKKMEFDTIMRTQDVVDIGYGADFRIEYTLNAEKRSFYLDVTGYVKRHVNYWNLTGFVGEENREGAYVYHMPHGEIRIGYKRQHHTHHFYVKPVLVLEVRNHADTRALPTELDLKNIVPMLKMAHESLVMQGYDKEASLVVRPNPKLYRNKNV